MTTAITDGPASTSPRWIKSSWVLRETSRQQGGVDAAHHVVDTLTQVAAGLAAAGRHQQAEQLARSISDPDAQASGANGNRPPLHAAAGIADVIATCI